jgi:alanine racemase
VKRRQFLECAAIGGGAVIPAAGCRDSTEGRTGVEKGGEIQAGPNISGHGNSDPRVEVDLDHIGWNLDRVRERARVPVLAVVKANAYGHGLVEVGKYLEGRGAAGLMVGKLAEALSLRTAGVRRPIFNFGPFGGEDAAAVLEAEIVQSVFTDDVRSLHEAAVRAGRRASVNVHVDTGMNRAGVPFEEAPAFLETVAGFSGVAIKGISTTFTEDPEFDGEQLRRFLDVCDTAGKKGIEVGLRHAASSAGVFYRPEFHLDMVRPGIALYGYYPNAATREENALALKPALRFVGRVTSLRDLKAGESLSYLRAFRAAEPMRVATVGVGYSDGYSPALGGRGFALVGEKSFPVLPTVTSNHIMVDVKNDGSVKVGDEIVLVDDRRGSGVAADALAELGGISDYKILIGLNPDLPRTHAGGEK